MEIIREKDSLGFDVIRMTKESMTLTIFFGGNGDIYWNLNNLDDFDSQDESFIISPSDGPIFELFQRLFFNIATHQIFRIDEVEASFCRTPEALERLRAQKQKDNESLSTHPYFDDLCNGSYVKWHSDNEPFETGNVLTLLLDQAGNVIINIKRISRGYDFLNVCFTHSGSRYSPFDLAFYDNYRELCEMDLSISIPSENSEDHDKNLERQLNKKREEQ